MGRRLRGLKAQAVIAAFERAGGVVRSGKGDHVNIKMPNGVIITVRSREEVRTGLLKDLLKKAQLTEKQFEEYLR